MATDTTPRELVQWAAPSASFLLHPLSVVGHRRSVGHPPQKHAGGWLDEARAVYRHTGVAGHPGYMAWVGAIDGAVDVLVTVASLSIDAAFIQTPVTAAGEDSHRKPSPYAHSWKLALLAAFERVTWTFFTRPLRVSRNILLAQLPNAGGQYRYTGQWAILQDMWNEHGPHCFTHSLVPAIAHELLSSVLFSLYDASAPLQTYALSSAQSRSGRLNSFIHSLCITGDEVLRTTLIALLTRPLEVVVRRLDIQGSGIEPRRIPYKGLLDCMVRILAEEGLGGFYRGAAPELVQDLAPAALLFIADLFISLVSQPAE